ncbi:hypothetical protein ACT3SZ_14920 [Corynebacterium sp. AOP40-9SA-29]|uniref:hypothetical protein n=1 Tax=Corynebacterium sp. AOP40-9SA-29 TaxID=3457677 RepID=UPI004034B535
MSEIQVALTDHAKHLVDNPDGWCVPDINNRTLDITWEQQAGLRTNVVPRDDLWFKTTRSPGDDGVWVEAAHIAHRDCQHPSCLDVHVARLMDSQELKDPDAMMFAVTETGTPDGALMIYAQDYEDMLDAVDDTEEGTTQ